MGYTKRFVVGWHFINWWQWSLGVSIDLRWPTIEVHLPGGFVRIGWELNLALTLGDLRWKCFRYSSANRTFNYVRDSHLSSWRP